MTTVSIIIAAYNASEVLERAVRSVAAQTWSEWELFIVDDCSTDGTLALAQSLAHELGDRVRVLACRENVGPAEARNVALAKVSGEWVSFLDADDEFTPSRLDTMLAAAADGIDIVVSRRAVVEVSGQEKVVGRAAADLDGAAALQEVLTGRTSPYLWDKLFRVAPIAGVRLVDVRRAEDKIFVVSACRAARRVRYLDDVLYRYYVSESSLTWSRVASVAETQRLNDAVAAGAGAAGPAVRVAALTAWVEVANQASVTLARDEATTRVRACADQYTWVDILAALRLAPLFGGLGLALKVLPGGYSRLYRAFSRRKLKLR